MSSLLTNHVASFADGTIYSVASTQTKEAFRNSIPPILLNLHGELNVTTVEFPKDSKGNPSFLWKFYWNCGRQGDLESVFVASQEEVDDLIGKRAYFGEVLGKHSEVYGNLETNDFTLLSKDANRVSLFSETVGSTGHNPFDYLEEE